MHDDLVDLVNLRKIACNETKVMSILHVNECFRIGIDLKNNSSNAITMSSSGSLEVIFDKPDNIKKISLASHMPFNIRILPGAIKPAITVDGYKILSPVRSVNAFVVATVVMPQPGDVRKFSKSFMIDIV